MNETRGVTALALVEIASRAGVAIMDVYARGAEVREKDDRSPVTEADEQAEAIILEALNVLDPALPVIAEEAVAAGHVPEHGARFALVDPLDGTREFLGRNGEFTVNIAVIEHGRPTLAVVFAPALSRVFVAEGPGEAWQGTLSPGEVEVRDVRALRIRACPPAGPVAVASRSHRSAETETVLARYGVSDTRAAGSSLKFCLVAAGDADLYPRAGRTMEWDTAAGQAVAEAAGARVVELATGLPLLYGKRERGYDNPDFIVLGDVSYLGGAG